MWYIFGVFIFVASISIQQGNQTVATYGYDIQNRRFRKTVGGTTTYYLYNLDDQLIAEISGTGTVLREYVWLVGEPFLLAEYTGANAGMYFYLNDHLGTPQQLLHGETGTVAWQAAYLPFGEVQVQVSTVTNNLRFPGQYYDVETGLHYNWNRYYSPKSGRYISVDPIGLDGEINLYSYASNNPVNWFDIEGLVRKGNKGDGSATGRNTSNPYKHCRQHPTKPNKLRCRHKDTGKWVTVDKPIGWDEMHGKGKSQYEICDDNCQETVKILTVIGITSFVVYKIGKTCILTAAAGPVGFGIGILTP